MFSSVKNLRRAVCWLACAFAITLAALITLGATTAHARYAAREQAAVLLAADILSLERAENESDSAAAVYLALIDSRMPQLFSAEECAALRSHLLSDDLSPLTSEIENMLSNGMSAFDFCSAIRAYLSDFAEEQEATLTEQSCARPVRCDWDTAARANALFGIPALFHTDAQCAPLTAYCQNAYVIFDRHGELQLYAAACPPGHMHLTETECQHYAERYVQRLLSTRMRVTDVRSADGVCMVSLAFQRERVLVFVRQDGGGVCLMWRNPPMETKTHEEPEMSLS